MQPILKAWIRERIESIKTRQFKNFAAHKNPLCMIYCQVLQKSKPDCLDVKYLNITDTQN